MIFIIEDDEVMAECVERAVRAEMGGDKDTDKVWRGVDASEVGQEADAYKVEKNSDESGVGQEDSSHEMRQTEVRCFSNAIEAMQGMNEELPRLIFLDVLLDGPDGFTLLHELVSYPDTAQIPVVIISSLDLAGMDLSMYGVVRVLDKTVMRPGDLQECVREFYGG